ncbi:MAG: phage head-tail connector protein [candidate division Zixibacteria bacterium]|nr:phage head-tail connector protein [candidate division Zixibacteria bacterium]NIS48984.1 phage head-tail connector protein [candidate division Zixibacteria bacterium]NIU17067.1 phage head-tail connector protein [candidate division Zixibacteria bacterium]NIW97068.1 hypothetical protein [Phycisphaerae bacterium]
MSITNGYCSLAELKSALGLEGVSTYDDELEGVIEGASRFIDNYCNRFFYQDDDATRYYTARDYNVCIVNDLRSIDSLATDDDGGRTYSETWTSADYDLYPLNPLNGEPYTMIKPTPNGTYQFPSFAKGVKIVGDFGWESVPLPVWRACVIQTERWWMRREAPFGIGGDSRRLGEIHIVSELDPDVKSALEGYRRYVVA